MAEPLFPSTIGTQSRSTKSLTLKTVVRKPQKNEVQTQTHVLCGCTTFGTELKLGTKLMRSLRLLYLGQGRGYYKGGGGVLEVTPWDQRSELSSATMIPQMTVVADLTRSED